MPHWDPDDPFKSKISPTSGRGRDACISEIFPVRAAARLAGRRNTIAGSEMTICSYWLRTCCLAILFCSSALPQAGRSVDPYSFEERSGGPPGALMGMRVEKVRA